MLVPPQGVAEVAKALMPLFRGDYEKVDLNILYQKFRNTPLKNRIEYDFIGEELLSKA